MKKEKMEMLQNILREGKYTVNIFNGNISCRVGYNIGVEDKKKNLMRVILYHDGKGVYTPVDELVALVSGLYPKNQDPYLYKVIHKDGDFRNCAYSNLKVVLKKEVTSDEPKIKIWDESRSCKTVSCGASL